MKKMISLLFITVVLGGCGTVNKNEEVLLNVRTVKPNIVYENEIYVDVAYDIYDPEGLYNLSDLVAIVEITKIHEGTNILPNGEYTSVYTPLDFTIKSLLKGDGTVEEVHAIHFGGTIKFMNWYAGLEERQQQRIDFDRIDTTSYVYEGLYSDVELELGKKYLVFLSKEAGIGGDTYGFMGLQLAMREIKEDQLKNNLSNEWEPVTLLNRRVSE